MPGRTCITILEEFNDDIDRICEALDEARNEIAELIDRNEKLKEEVYALNQ